MAALAVALLGVALPARADGSGRAVAHVAAEDGSAAAAAVAAATGDGAGYLPVAPVRVMPATTVTGGATYTLRLTGVPDGATAVALNVTAAAVKARTFISVCPGGTPLGTCREKSNLNAYPGVDVPNLVVATLGGAAGDEVTFYVDRGSVALIADLQGWYVPGAAGSRYVPTAPERVMQPTTVGDGGTHTLTLADVPSEATAVVLNVTAAAVRSRTFVSVCPGGTPAGTCRRSSNLNAYPGVDVPNLVVTKLGGPRGDQLTLYVDRGPVALIADLQGWFVPDTAAAGYIAVTPQRVMHPARVAGGATHVLTLQDAPAGATAAVLNVTASAVTARTFVSACPTGTAVAVCREKSNLNAYRGVDVANLVVAKLGGAGNEVTFYVDNGSVDLIADLQGWMVVEPDGADAYVVVDGEPVRIEAPGGQDHTVSIGARQAGERINIHVTGQTPGAFTLLRDGVPVGDPAEVLSSPSAAFDLPVAGRYAIRFDVPAMGHVMVTVSTPLRLAGDVDGVVTEAQLRPGQELELALPDIPGGRLNMRVDGGWPDGEFQTATLLAPGGEVVDRTTAWVGWQRSSSVQASVPGPYTLRLSPSVVVFATGPVTSWPPPYVVTLSTPVRTSLPVGGQALELPATRPGQELFLALGSVEAGERVTTFIGHRGPRGSAVTAALVDAAGEVVEQRVVRPSPGPFTATTPATGHYWLRLSPEWGDPAPWRLQASVPARLELPLGGAVDVSGLLAGQEVLLDLGHVPVGDPVRVHAHATVPLQPMQIGLLDGDGVVVRWPWWATGHVYTEDVPVAGRYSLLVIPGEVVPPPFTVSASLPLRVDVPLDGAVVTISDTLPAQQLSLELGALPEGRTVELVATFGSGGDGTRTLAAELVGPDGEVADAARSVRSGEPVRLTTTSDGAHRIRVTPPGGVAPPYSVQVAEVR